MDKDRFPKLIGDLYRIVGEFEAMFPGRHFTPDGHMVGSLGESLAAYYYGIELHPASHPGNDGVCGGREVQIKATQGNSVAMRCEPSHLLVLKLDRNGGFEEVYNGPGAQAWALVCNKPMPSNGQRSVRLSSLRKLMRNVPGSQRLPLIRPIADAVETQIEQAHLRSTSGYQASPSCVFENKLVPPDPADEPAAALLEGLKASWGTGSNGHCAAIRNKADTANMPINRRSRGRE